MSKSLIDIATEKKRIYELIAALGGEMDIALEQWLDHVNTELQYKTDSYRVILDELEAEAERLKKRAQEFDNASRTVANIGERLRGRIKDVMAHIGTETLEGDLYRFRISDGQKKLVLDESLVPQNYQIVETTTRIDKERIKADLKNGIEVPGARLEPVTKLNISIRKGK